MSNTAVANLGTGRGSDVSSRPSVALRLDVLAHRGSLDRRLVEGRRTDRDAAIALRARQLTSERSRETVAHTLARTVDARGVAMLRELLGNGASPIYAPSLNGAPSDGQLAHCLQQAADALETARQGRRGVLSHD